MATIPERKLLRLKYKKYFRGRKEKKKEAKSKAKGFFPRKQGVSQNAMIVHSLSKIIIPDPLSSLRESKFTLTLFPFL